VSSWRLERLTGTAEALHHRDLPDPLQPTVWVMTWTVPALVLGSAQPLDTVDLRAARDVGVEVVRRRSGGGAVLLVPGDAVWVDVLIPAGHEWWRDDVARSFLPVGEAWAAALGGSGAAVGVHPGPVRHTAWSRLACFAGLGTGEVLARDRKLVGLSQRRTRRGARIQGVVHRRFDPDGLTRLLAPAVGDGAALRSWLDGHVGVVDRPAEEIVTALVDVLGAVAATA
jgi:lipoate-protein ligase A